MRYHSKRSKATDIPQSVKIIVYARDEGLCIFCGRPGLPNAHFIARSQGGLGIEENIITACPVCHQRMDNSTDRKRMKQVAAAYLRSQYPDWDEKKLVYRKWGFE